MRSSSDSVNLKALAGRIGGGQDRGGQDPRRRLAREPPSALRSGEAGAPGQALAITLISISWSGKARRGVTRMVLATTGAGLWAVGAIGIASGFGYYLHAAAITVLALFVLTVLGLVERDKAE